MEPQRFLDYVHEIDLSGGGGRSGAGRARWRISRGASWSSPTAPGATPSACSTAWVWRAHFDAIHDIAAIDYRPKPDPSGYRDLIARYGIAPARAAMIEDMARNLPPAAALGMTTVWLKNGPHPELECRLCAAYPSHGRGSGVVPRRGCDGAPGHSGRGMNSSSPGTLAKRPAFQSRLGLLDALLGTRDEVPPDMARPVEASRRPRAGDASGSCAVSIDRRSGPEHQHRPAS